MPSLSLLLLLLLPLASPFALPPPPLSRSLLPFPATSAVPAGDAGAEAFSSYMLKAQAQRLALEKEIQVGGGGGGRAQLLQQLREGAAVTAASLTPPQQP